MSDHRILACLAIWGTLWLAAAQSTSPLKYVPPEKIPPSNGGQMFRAYCAVCHGMDGRGGGPAAPSLKKQPADLTQLSRKNQGKFPVFRVANVIQGYGFGGAHGSRDMPVWGVVFRTLGDESTVKLRVDNLTAYIDSLQAN
jgi:mono/diheme cytochrome c family protein